MVKSERRTGEAELGYRIGQYEVVLDRHAQLLDAVRDFPYYDEEPLPGVDPITRLPDIRRRRTAAQRILPALVAHPEPLNVNRRGPIPHPEFGNPLRWCANNIETVIPEEPVDFIQLVDQIYLAYDVIYGSFDVRSVMQGKNISLKRRERIGGTNDYLSIYNEIKGGLGLLLLNELASELCWDADFHRRGIQAAIGGMPVIGHSDFLEELRHVAGYVRNERTEWGDYKGLPLGTELTRQDIKGTFETISTIGEHALARKPLEDEGLQKLTQGGFRIAHDLVTDGWYVRT